MKRKLLSLALLAGMTLNLCADDLDDMVALTQTIHGFKANFNQKIKDQFGNVKDQSSGLFKLLKPQQFIWETQQPFEQQIVSDGHDLWTYDKDLDQVNVQTLNTALGNTPVLLITSNAESLRKTFKVSRLHSGESEAQTFELTPVSPGQAFERMIVLFKQNLPQEILLMDSLGQQTVVDFNEASLNPEFSDDSFKFELPIGVDLVDSREATKERQQTLPENDLEKPPVRNQSIPKS